MKKIDISESSLFFRFMRLFTKIEACEIPVTLLLTINIFLLLVAYYIIKPVRDALILTGRGAEMKTYLVGGQVLLLIFIVKAYVRLACKVPRHKLIARTTLFFMSNLLVFYVLALMNVPVRTLGILFFIWVGIFNLLVVAQFWAFANDIYTQDEGKRLFPIIAFGATFGAFVGSKIAGWLMTPLGVYQMLLVAGGILAICVALSLFIHHIEIKKTWTKVIEISSYCAIEDLIHSQPLKRGGGFNLIFKKQYLLYTAILIFIVNLVNTNGEYILAKVVTQSAADLFGAGDGLEMTQWIGKFYADFYLAVSLASMLIQLFLVSRIFKWVGIKGALLVLPIIAFSGYLFVSLGASLILVKWVKILENGTDYSLMNTARHALFLFTSREAKYKAIATISTFFWRSGDVTSALIVFFGSTYFSFNVESFALFNVVMVGIWIIFSLLVIREQNKLTHDGFPLVEKA